MSDSISDNSALVVAEASKFLAFPDAGGEDLESQRIILIKNIISDLQSIADADPEFINFLRLQLSLKIKRKEHLQDNLHDDFSLKENLYVRALVDFISFNIRNGEIDQAASTLACVDKLSENEKLAYARKKIEFIKQLKSISSTCYNKQFDLNKIYSVLGGHPYIREESKHFIFGVISLLFDSKNYRNRFETSNGQSMAVLSENVKPIKLIFVIGKSYSGSGAVTDFLKQQGCYFLKDDHRFISFSKVMAEFDKGNDFSFKWSLWDYFCKSFLGLSDIDKVLWANWKKSSLKHFNKQQCHAFQGVLSFFHQAILAYEGKNRTDFLLSINSYVKFIISLSASLSLQKENLVVLNNFVKFDLSVLEAFSSDFVFIVSRNPLDMCADQLSKNSKIKDVPSFLRKYRSVEESHDRMSFDHVINVEFEEFVKSAAYRERMIMKPILGERFAKEFCVHEGVYFNANNSIKNIGVYKSILSDDQIELLRSELKLY